MAPETLTQEINLAFMAAFAFAGPILIVGAMVGLVIAIFQAVTQIQEQAFPQTVKIIVITAMLLGLGTRLASPIIDHGTHVFAEFPRLVP